MLSANLPKNPGFRRAAHRLATLLAGLSVSLHAADIYKLDNTDDMALGSSWDGGVAPGADDIAVFDSRIAGGSYLALDSSVAWRGFKVVDNAPEITLDTLFAPSIPTLTLGNGGIDMSEANPVRFVLDAPTMVLPSATAQTWSVADGATLVVKGNLNRAAGATLDVHLGDNGTGKIVVDSGTFGATGSLIHYATIDGSDIAAIQTIEGDDELERIIVPGSTIFTYTENPLVDPDVNVNPNIGESSHSIIDVVNSNTANPAATALRITGNWSVGGIRFNTPHAEGMDWTVDTTSTSRNINIGNGSILVGPGVGAGHVRFTGSSNLRLSNQGNQDLFIHQHNPHGNLYIGIPINAAVANHRLVKDGVGRVIYSGTSSLTSGTYISEGAFQIGEGGTSGDVMSPVFNEGILAFSRSDAYTFGQVISGSGSVEILGPGVTSLTAENTFTGPVLLRGGVLSFASAANLGEGTVIESFGGGLRWATGNDYDISERNVIFTSGSLGVDTNGNDVAFLDPIGGGGTGGLTKSGSGTLSLYSANQYSGQTTVNGGELRLENVSGSATGSGNVLVSSGGTLAGTGSASGAVTVASTGVLSPGSDGVGTLTVGSLTLNSGSVLNFEFSGLSNNDLVVVSNSGGLNISGGAVNILSAGGAVPYTTPGTYDLIQYSGAIAGTGPSALSVANPQPGYTYSFSSSGNTVTLTITQLGMITQWTATGSGSFASSGNWNNGVPSGAGATANFTTNLASDAIVTLDGTRTLGGLTFSSAPGGYTVSQGTGGSLVLENNGADVAIGVLLGDHYISAPVVVGDNLAIGTAASTSLAFTGTVSGTGNISKTGPGELILAGENSITGSTSVTGGVLEFWSGNSIGNGALYVDDGTLRYGGENNADISNRTFTIGVYGATVDTNGNDVIFAHAIGNGGAGGFTKAGEGTLTFLEPATYLGATTLAGGTLRISSDSMPNSASTGLIFNGGMLEPTESFSTARSVTVGAGGGGFNVPEGVTLTVGSALTGSGGAGKLIKSGSGTLILNQASTFAGGVQLRQGRIIISNTTAAGSGALEMSDGATVTIGNSSTFITTPVTVSGANANVYVTTEHITGGIASQFTGTADQSVTIDGTLAVNFSAASTKQFQNFPGTVIIPAEKNLAFRATALNNGGDNTTFHVDGVLTSRNAGNMALGALTGSGTLSMGGSGGNNQNLVYTIGAKNLDTTFSGVIEQADLANGKLVGVTKVGTGKLTLSGASTYTGPTNVNAGTLQIDGSLAETNVTVAAGATLGGTGSIAGNVTINNGTLKPGVPDASGARLSIGGSLSLYGGASPVSSVTEIDFDGAAFVGIKVNGSVSYAGSLQLNFTDSKFNGSYQLFDLASTPSGTFDSVSASSPSTTIELTYNGGSGSWTGVLDGATLSFNPTSGVLTVTNALPTPSAPGSSTLSAVAGAGKVDLSWTSAANADTYTVKRSTIEGGPYTNVISALAGTSYSDTSVTNGTTYYYVVQARNSSSGLTGALSNEVSATPVGGGASYTDLQNWRFEQFGVYDDDDSILAGDNEDFDGDGLVNILEYALDTNPKVANASPVVVGRSGNFLTLTYPRKAVADPALTYEVQASNDLTASFTSVGGGTNTSGSTYTYTDNVDISQPGVRRFLRLSVSYTTE